MAGAPPGRVAPCCGGAPGMAALVDRARERERGALSPRAEAGQAWRSYSVSRARSGGVALPAKPRQATRPRCWRMSAAYAGNVGERGTRLQVLVRSGLEGRVASDQPIFQQSSRISPAMTTVRPILSPCSMT